MPSCIRYFYQWSQLASISFCHIWGSKSSTLLFEDTVNSYGATPQQKKKLFLKRKSYQTISLISLSHRSSNFQLGDKATLIHFWLLFPPKNSFPLASNKTATGYTRKRSIRLKSFSRPLLTISRIAERIFPTEQKCVSSCPNWHHLQSSFTKGREREKIQQEKCVECQISGRCSWFFSLLYQCLIYTNQK